MSAMPETIAFDDLVEMMAKAKPVYARPIKGMGKRILIPMVFKFGERLAEFFCEAVILADRPSDPSLGYTGEDVNYFRGVMLYDVEFMNMPKDKKPDGEVLFFDDFLAKYVNDPATRVYLHRKMDELEDGVLMDEESLESVNQLWLNREVGEKIVDVKLN